MTNLKNKQTGPITEKGKQRSSMNARTHGLYTNTLLPSERPDDLKSLVASLQKDWPLRCTTGGLLIYQLALIMIRKSRLEAARSVLSVKGHHEHLSRLDFCLKLGLDSNLADRLPDWFFDDDPKVIELCEFAARLRKQINFLRDNFSTQLVEMARTNLPDLWLDLMGSPAPNFNTSIVERMCQVHKCESSELAVISHQEFTKEHYKYELLWIDKRERIKSVIDVIRANQIIHAMSRSDLMKLETSLERQTIDTIRQLMALVEFQQRHAQVIELDASQEI
jgi:hypothetical protein